MVITNTSLLRRPIRLQYSGRFFSFGIFFQLFYAWERITCIWSGLNPCEGWLFYNEGYWCKISFGWRSAWMVVLSTTGLSINCFVISAEVPIDCFLFFELLCCGCIDLIWFSFQLCVDFGGFASEGLSFPPFCRHVQLQSALHTCERRIQALVHLRRYN